MAGSVGGAGAGAGVGEVQIGCSHSEYGGRTDSTAGSEGEGERNQRGSKGGDGRWTEVHSRDLDLLDIAIAIVGDEDVAVSIHRHGNGIVEAAAQRVDGGVAARGQHFINGTTTGIGDKDVATAVHGQANGTAKIAAHPGEVAASRHELFHRAVVWKRDEHVAACVYRHAFGIEDAAGQRVDSRVAARRQDLLYRAVALARNE